MKAYLAIWAVFPVLIPFYLMGTERAGPQLAGAALLPNQFPTKMESGVPQIADYWMVLLMVLVFAGPGILLLRRTVPSVLALSCFVFYALVVNTVWSILTNQPDLPFLRSSLFYVYDFLLLVVFLVLYARFGDDLLRVTLYALAASVFLQVLLSAYALDRSTFRQSLYFNNPNQLGYFAVLTGSIFYLGTVKIRINPYFQVLFYVGAGYLAALSLSKAALFGFGLLLLLILGRRASGLLLGAALLGGVVVLGLGQTTVWENLERRLESDSTDDSLGKRGYDRIFNHPEYLVFGAGEGAHHRFISDHPGEMHSSWGTMIFCYGVIGAGLFLFGLFRLLRGVPFQAGLALLPIFFYGSAHQGLRFTLFWVFLAFLCCLKKAPESACETDLGYAGADQEPTERIMA